MADWELQKDQFVTGEYAADTSASTITTATSSLTANTKGSWVELIASTTGHTNLIRTNLAADQYELLVDIGVGAAASEVVILPDLYTSCRDNISRPFYEFAVSIPDGSRVAYRCMSAATTTDGLGGFFVCLGGGVNNNDTPIVYDAYGLQGGTVGGTTVNPGTTPHTKSSWVELTASLTHDIQYGFIKIGDNRNTSRQNYSFLFDVGIGAAASEVVIASNLGFLTGTSETVTPSHFHIPVQIPAGTRVAIRAQSNGTTSDTVFEAAFYGVRSGT